MDDKRVGLIVTLMTAVSDCALYDDEHPEILHLCEKAVHEMEDLFFDDALNITVLGNSLLFNDLPLKEKSIHITSLMKQFRKKGIDKVVITKGTTPEEVKKFISDLALHGRVPSSSEHISMGVVEVRFKAEAGDEGLNELVEENVQKVKEVHEGLTRFKELNMVGLEDVILSFISTFRAEAGILRSIVPVKTHSEYTYTHITNVSVLSMFQAESLGIKREFLHDIGLSGLLHDVGKMFIPKEIIEKKEKLESHEWDEIQKHPYLGANYLSLQPNVPGIAIIAAFEHHMKYNASGYPKTKRKGRKQHFVSQIIAISDFFDALRTERPYRKALEVGAIIGLLNELSGVEFNPLLVNNFLLSLDSLGIV